MKKISIISDTHGLLRDEVKAELLSSDIIIHAGDIDKESIVRELKSYGELYIVRGNNDKEWADYLPLLLTVTIEGVRFLITHNKNDIPKDLNDIDVVIYGHSHQYDATVCNGTLLLNPGSCGRRRFNLEVSMCCMNITEGTYDYKKIVL